MTGRSRRSRGPRDAGVTLIEVVVSMSIMSVFMAMFTVGIVQMSRSAARNQAIADAQSQVGLAFLRLDKEIRYSSGVSVPARLGQDWYVEWTATSADPPMCTQLRLHVEKKQLQWRTWNALVEPIAPTPWLPLASEVESTEPFTRSLPSGSEQFQRLRVYLVSVVGLAEKQSRKATDITFTALNTSTSTKSDNVCAVGRSVP